MYRKWLFLIVFFFLSSCGFKPLYYKSDIRQNSIYVAPIPEFMGQKLRFELISRLSPSGMPKNPDYKLVVSLEKKIYEKQGLKEDSTSTRYTMQIKAQITLKSNGKDVLKDTIVSRSSYDILSMPYATTSSVKTAEDNAIVRLADQISLRLDVYLKDKNKDISKSENKK